MTKITAKARGYDNVSQKMCKIIFVRTLSNFYHPTNSENFWDKDGKEDKLMRAALIFRLI